MNKLPYYSPDVIFQEIMTGNTILEGSDDPNTISPLDFFDLDEE